MCSKFRVVLSLGFAFCVTEVSAATITEYTFVFERANALVILDPPPGSSDDIYTARVYESAGYRPTVSFGFSHDDSLDGTTIDFSALLSLRDGWFEPVIDWWPKPRGHVTFGAGNEVVDWAIGSDGEGWGFSWNYASDPTTEGLGWLAPYTLNPELLPLEHYGLLYSEPNYWSFQTSPGRWTLSTNTYCLDCPVEVVSAPLPLSGLLLLSGLGVLLARARLACRPGSAA